MFYQFQPYNYIYRIPLLPLFIGYSHLQEPVFRAIGTDYYQWFFCTQGYGELIVNHQRSLIQKGMGFFLQPKEAHGYYNLTGDWTLHVIGFNGSLCPELLKQLDMTLSGSYYFSANKLFEYFIRLFLEADQKKSSDKPFILSSICYHFLLELRNAITKTRNNPESEKNMLVIKVTAYLEDHYSSAITLDELAQLVHLSKDYLCTLFKKYTHHTIIDYLIKIRLGHACTFLMQYPDKTAAEIGNMCGFASPSYFGKIFRKNYGITPNEYRKTRYSK